MLTDEQRKVLRIALGSKGDDGVADEIADQIDSGGNPVAGAVAAIGAAANLSALSPTASAITASAGVFAIPAEPTGAEVDTAIDALKDKVDAGLDLKADNADVETLRTEVEARLDTIETKIDAVIAALKAAGLMAS